MSNSTWNANNLLSVFYISVDTHKLNYSSVHADETSIPSKINNTEMVLSSRHIQWSLVTTFNIYHISCVRRLSLTFSLPWVTACYMHKDFIEVHLPSLNAITVRIQNPNNTCNILHFRTNLFDNVATATMIVIALQNGWFYCSLGFDPIVRVYCSLNALT